MSVNKGTWKTRQYKHRPNRNKLFELLQSSHSAYFLALQTLFILSTSFMRFILGCFLNRSEVCARHLLAAFPSAHLLQLIQTFLNKMLLGNFLIITYSQKGAKICAECSHSQLQFFGIGSIKSKSARL